MAIALPSHLSAPSFRVRSQYSPDGFGTIKELVEQSAKYENPALTVSDCPMMNGAGDPVCDRQHEGIKWN